MMNSWCVVPVVVCAQVVVAVNEGRLQLKEPALHEHPTLVAMAKQSNSYRLQNGLTSQTVSPYLTELAQTHANWMANSGRFQHNYDHAFPEIIYFNAGSVESAFAGWMNSGPHRSIILNGSTHVGFGYAISPSGQTYWCGVFGSLREERLAKRDAR